MGALLLWVELPRFGGQLRTWALSPHERPPSRIWWTPGRTMGWEDHYLSRTIHFPGPVQVTSLKEP